MAAISAYDVGKKRITYQNDRHEISHSISTASVLNSFRFLKFEKNKIWFKKLIFFKKNLMMSYLDSSHFSDNNGYIICRISIYRFKDIKYAILNE